MGLQLRPGVGTGGDWPAPRVLRSPSPAPRCRHPPPRWALTGFPAWEGSARKSEASGDRGHLLLGHKCPKRRWGWEDVPVNETPLPDVSTRCRACPWTAGQHPCCSSRQRRDSSPQQWRLMNAPPPIRKLPKTSRERAWNPDYLRVERELSLVGVWV